MLKTWASANQNQNLPNKYDFSLILFNTFCVMLHQENRNGFKLVVHVLADKSVSSQRVYTNLTLILVLASWTRFINQSKGKIDNLVRFEIQNASRRRCCFIYFSGNGSSRLVPSPRPHSVEIAGWCARSSFHNLETEFPSFVGNDGFISASIIVLLFRLELIFESWASGKEFPIMRLWTNWLEKLIFTEILQGRKSRTSDG